MKNKVYQRRTRKMNLALLLQSQQRINKRTKKKKTELAAMMTTVLRKMLPSLKSSNKPFL
ncbi:hypothetical protein A2U01_0074914, partial [Trifolium medium]|nr:hypothetical protein [Trifolium medium]